MWPDREAEAQTVWIAEAVHRTANLRHLIANIDRLLARGGVDPADCSRTAQRAAALLRAYDDLASSSDVLCPCTQAIANVVGGLVEMFGHSVRVGGSSDGPATFGTGRRAPPRSRPCCIGAGGQCLAARFRGQASRNHPACIGLRPAAAEGGDAYRGRRWRVAGPRRDQRAGQPNHPWPGRGT